VRLQALHKTSIGATVASRAGWLFNAMMFKPLGARKPSPNLSANFQWTFGCSEQWFQAWHASYSQVFVAVLGCRACAVGIASTANFDLGLLFEITQLHNALIKHLVASGLKKLQGSGHMLNYQLALMRLPGCRQVAWYGWYNDTMGLLLWVLWLQNQLVFFNKSGRQTTTFPPRWKR
jgi:hypothetical protein